MDSPEEPMAFRGKIPKERGKTVLAFFIMWFTFFMSTLSLAIVHDKMPDREIYTPLPDIVLDSVPTQEWALVASEAILLFGIVSVNIMMFSHSHRWVLFRRGFLLVACLFLMRSITIHVTLLPVPSYTYYCAPKSNSTSGVELLGRVFDLLSTACFSTVGKYDYCGDYIFSGHSANLILSYLLFKEYTPDRMYILHWISKLLCLAGVVLLLISRGHYTIDVIVAYYVCTRLFWTYHTLVDGHIQLSTGIQPDSRAAGTRFFGRVWWFPIFQYMEKNVKVELPKEYSRPWGKPDQTIKVPVVSEIGF